MEDKQFEEMRTNIENIKTVLLSFNKKLDQQSERIAQLERGTTATFGEVNSQVRAQFQSNAQEVFPQDTIYNTNTPSESPILNTSNSHSFNLAEWLSVDWPMRVGALLLILGMGWFVSYAFLNNWIGPVGRVSLGLIVGATLLAFGQVRLRKTVEQGIIFIALGAVFLFMTISAARYFYDFFDPVSASLFMLLVVTYIAFVSIQMKNKTLAVMGLLLGSIVPLLVGSSEDSFVNVFLYLFILSLGASIVTWKIGYRVLLVMNLFVVMIYSLPYTLFESSFDHFVGLMFAGLFASLFFVISFMTMLRNGQIDTEDLAVSSLNSLALLFWIRVAVEDEWRGFVCVAVALVLSIVAYFIALTNQKHQSFAYFRFASAFLFVFAATLFQFSGPVLVLVLAAEFMLLALTAKKLLHAEGIAKQVAACMVIPIVMSLPYLLDYFDGGYIETETYVVLIGMIGMLSVLGFTLRSTDTVIDVATDDAREPLMQTSASSKNPTSSLAHIFTVIAAVYTILFVWILFHDMVTSYTLATFIALLLYTLVGIALYVSGKMTDNTSTVRYGGLLFALVVARLLLFDIWEMSITGRIVTFFIIGSLLMSTAFAGRKNQKSDTNTLDSSIIS